MPSYNSVQFWPIFQSSIMMPFYSLMNITNLNQALLESGVGNTYLITDMASEARRLEPAAPHKLLADQHRAYDIIDRHLQQFISGKCPKPMRMIMIPGKAGVGKSKTIQTITENFVAQGMGNTLDKGAYTGLATSIIDGKMLHSIAMMPLQGGKQSVQMMKVLDEYWKDNHYLIINEISMVS